MSASPCKLYTMTMVYEHESGRVLVLDRCKTDWPGLTFPGGHVEPGESLTACAAREIAEETGLSVRNLTPCGVVHWADATSGLRYLEFLYKTEDFSGILSEGTDEGKVFFLSKEDLLASDRLSQNFDEYLPVFFGDGWTELYYEWDGKAFTGVPQYYSHKEERNQTE